MIATIDLKINHKPVRLEVDGNRTLFWVLRTDLGLTGTKYGCGESYCGACTVLVNDKAVRSCQTAVKDVKGKNVVTIEGLAVNGKLHPLQKAFVEHDALQCGFCTPGMILTAEIPRFSILPKIETILVENRDLAPQGGGEPGITCVGAAIANAIFDATGARLFKMAMTPERVKAALKTA